MPSVSIDHELRPLRADARRNRELLLEAAVRNLLVDADVPLEAIARDAGVGIGTLYRHFPTRGALIEAAYRNELDRVCEAASGFLATLPADEAFGAWLDRLVEFVIAKRGMSSALQSLCAPGSDSMTSSRERLHGVIGEMLTVGAGQGTLRSDVDAYDVLTTISGIFSACTEPNFRDQSSRLLKLMLDGLRHGAGATKR